MLKSQFDNYQNPQALMLALTLSRSMHNMSANDTLHYNSHFTGLNKKATQEVLAQLTPENLRRWHISDDQKTDNTLVYADGSYRVTPLNTETLIANNDDAIKSIF